MIKNLDDMRNKELQLLIIEYNKAAQLDRSFSKTNLSESKKKEFREKLLFYCLELMKSADDCTLCNIEIRKRIDLLEKIDPGISYGQAQKVVNVVIKNYCFLINCNESILKELDCPLDSITMKGYGIKNKSMIRVTREDYIKYQEVFAQEYKIRILKDLEYDSQRIHKFYMG